VVLKSTHCGDPHRRGSACEKWLKWRRLVAGFVCQRYRHAGSCLSSTEMVSLISVTLFERDLPFYSFLSSLWSWYGTIYDMIRYYKIGYYKIRYDMLWYIWYDMIWYDTILYNTIWYGMIWYGMIRYDMIR
jgi:hypothetical protein